MLDIDKLKSIKDTIEQMNKCYQIEVLKLLTDESSVQISENSNGTFINLSTIDLIIINKLLKYIEYVNKQQDNLSYIEDEKTNIKNSFFNSDTKNTKIVKDKTNSKNETDIIVNVEQS